MNEITRTSAEQRLAADLKMRLGLKAAGLTPVKHIALQIIALYPSNGTTLSTALRITTAASSGLIERLEAQGLVTRVWVKDRRKKPVQITTKGKLTLSQIAASL